MSPFIPLGTKLNPKLDSMSQTASEDDKSRDNELPEKLGNLCTGMRFS